MAATDRSRELALVAANAAADKKAHDIIVLDVSDQLIITDCFVIASAPNERQVSAIVDGVEEKMREAGVKPVRREGAREGRWVLLDFVDVVVHVQHSEERSFYALERLWKDCPRIEFDPEPAESSGRGPDQVTLRRVVLWRHGETDHNAAGRWQGHLDSALTPTGWNQARFAVPALAKFDPEIVVSSDLRRALDTATVFTEATGVPLRIDKRLRETNLGRWQGLNFTEVEAQVARRNRGLATRRRPSPRRMAKPASRSPRAPPRSSPNWTRNSPKPPCWPPTAA